MYTDNLYDTVLLNPIKQYGADELLIVSGYATAAMASIHLEHVIEMNPKIKISLVLGMSSKEGVSIVNHEGFKKIAGQKRYKNFSCYYLMGLPAVHAKVYGWYRKSDPACGFVGSANYTQNAFSKNQREIMDAGQPDKIRKYHNGLLKESIKCTDSNVDKHISFYRQEYEKRTIHLREETIKSGIGVLSTSKDYYGLSKVTLSLLTRNGSIHKSSGLNWGFRPNLNRNKNEAYIPVPAEIARSGFFPQTKVRFTVLTDDNQVLDCTIAQQNSKAIETPKSNRILGEYFRYRIGMQPGAFVNKSDLTAYGRTDVDFYRIDDESYYMDFSV